MDQQSDRWTSLLGSLRQIKGRGMYASSRLDPVPTDNEDEKSGKDASEDEGEKGDTARLTYHNEEEDDTTTTSTLTEGLLPTNAFSSLSTSLGNLLTAFNSTSTTRTSLLSTVEGYSSYLHRQVYRRSQPFSSGGIKSGGGYSMGTLSANLAQAGGSQRRPFDIYGQPEDGDADDEVKLEDMGVKSQEWDAVRKEVRAIKGMLLSRRNFVPQDTDSR